MLGETIDVGASGGCVPTQERGNDKFDGGTQARVIWTTLDFLIRTRQKAELLESGRHWKRHPAAWILNRAETALL